MGASVLEIVSDFDGNTFRAVYTVKIKGVIYVLHAFQKKIPEGHRDAKIRAGQDQAQIERSQAGWFGARAMKKARYDKEQAATCSRTSGSPTPPRIPSRQTSCCGSLARIKSKGLTQAKAASLLGLAQPDVSKLLRGHFAGYTYDRLFGYLNALGERVFDRSIGGQNQERRPT